MTQPGMPGAAEHNTARQPPAELDPVVDGTPEQLTERALIDALLHDHRRLDDIAEWLLPTDVSTPDAHAIYTTLLGLRSEGELPPLPADRSIAPSSEAITSTVMSVHRAWRVQRFTDVRCPAENRVVHLYGAHPPGPSQHLTYARDTVADAARRTLHSWAIRLRNAATMPQVIDGELSTFTHTAETLTAYLTAVGARLTSPSRTLTDVLKDVEHPSTVEPPPEPEYIPTPPAPPPPALVRNATQQLVEAVLTTPSLHNTTLLERLDPGELDAAPAHANVWRAMQSLRDQQCPIDYISVARETRALALTGPILTPNELARVAASTHTAPTRALRMVVHNALARHAEHAYQQMFANENDHTATLSDLRTRTNQITSTLEHHTRRLTANPTTPPRPTRAQTLNPGSATRRKH